jgi:hypothetical protein
MQPENVQTAREDARVPQDQQGNPGPLDPSGARPRRVAGAMARNWAVDVRGELQSRDGLRSSAGFCIHRRSSPRDCTHGLGESCSGEGGSGRAVGKPLKPCKLPWRLSSSLPIFGCQFVWAWRDALTSPQERRPGCPSNTAYLRPWDRARRPVAHGVQPGEIQSCSQMVPASCCGETVSPYSIGEFLFNHKPARAVHAPRYRFWATERGSP